MAVEQAGQIFAHEKTRQFLLAAHGAGAVYKDPPTLEKKPAYWRNRWITIGFFSTPYVLADFAREYNLTRERIRRILGSTITDIHTNCPPGLQKTFPLSDIPLKKPWSIVSGKRLSTAHGGRAPKIAAQLELGKNIRQVKQELNLDGNQLSQARKTLRSWSVEVPYINVPNDFNQQLVKKLMDRQADDQTVNELLAQVKVRFYMNDAKKGHPVLNPLTDVLQQAGLHSYSGGQRGVLYEVAKECLQQSGITVEELLQVVRNGPQKGVHRYRFIARIHTQRAIATLQSSPGLQQFLSLTPKRAQ